MAGVPGRSGGARPGAGRKPKERPKPVPVVEIAPAEPADMLDFLQKVALGLLDATPTQVRAAVAAVQYTHTKRHDGGKKEEVAEKAAKTAAGRFGAAAAPLKVINGGK